MTLNALFSALILFVQYLADFTETFRTVRWLMGVLDVGSYTPIVAALCRWSLACAGVRVAAARARSLEHGRASRPRRAASTCRARERLAFVSASLATGAAVSLGGPIGFIGIIVPHLVRLLVGADHRLVLPASALFGAAFLSCAISIARTVFGAAGVARRHHHRHHWRAVLPMAPVPTRQITRRSLGLAALSGVLLGVWP